MILSNFHTHTCLCDGKNTAEEMVLSAIENGCKAIGFSGHSYLDFATDWCMSIEETKQYCKIIKELKEKYKGKIKIYCGIELDYFSNIDTKEFDYVIGSVHYVYKDGKYIPVDETPELLKADVDKYFDGDFYSLSEAYFREVADVYNKTKCDIIGHFDLITKFNERENFFDEENPRYQKSALEAFERLKNTGAIFELNTGAISRGWRTSPYPAEFILEKIAQTNCKLIITSDSHSVDTINYWFENAIKLAKKYGINSIYEPCKKEYKKTNI